MSTATIHKPALRSRIKPAARKQPVRPVVEHPAPPLSDADREIFLAMLDSDEEPNDALRAAAEKFKRAFPKA